MNERETLAIVVTLMVVAFGAFFTGWRAGRSSAEAAVAEAQRREYEIGQMLDHTIHTCVGVKDWTPIYPDRTK